MIWHRIAAAILTAAISAGCGAPRAQTDIAVKNNHLEMNFADPNDASLGYRFIHGGWLRDLKLAGKPEELLLTESLFSYHPAFGFAREILPGLPLSAGRELKIGVGIIQPHPKTRFRPQPVELFPWHVERHDRDGKTVLTAEQRSTECEGYAYAIRVTVTVQADAPVILFEESLENTGRLPIVGEVYAHPFFIAPRGFRESWYIQPERLNFSANGTAVIDALPKRLADAPESRTLSGKQIPEGFHWIAAGTPTWRCILGADRPFSKTQFWRDEVNCFAVEPFIDISVEPGKRIEWKWYLIILDAQTREFAESTALPQ